MKKALKVLVAGPPNTGKTTVARLIEAALKDAGFASVKVSDLDPTPDKADIRARVEATKLRPVDIEVQQTSRAKPGHPREGLHAYRYQQNPHEKIAAELWDQQHPEAGGRGTLPYLLGDGATPVDPSERDWIVANTVVQWLGSPVGRGFLEQLQQRWDEHDGKERKSRKESV